MSKQTAKAGRTRDFTANTRQVNRLPSQTCHRPDYTTVYGCAVSFHQTGRATPGSWFNAVKWRGNAFCSVMAQMSLYRT